MENTAISNVVVKNVILCCAVYMRVGKNTVEFARIQIVRENKRERDPYGNR